MTDKVDQALGAIGLDPGDVDPDVLAGLRKAASKPPKQLTRDDLARLKPDEVVAAEQAGKLDTLLGRKAN